MRLPKPRLNTAPVLKINSCFFESPCCFEPGQMIIDPIYHTKVVNSKLTPDLFTGCYQAWMDALKPAI